METDIELLRRLGGLRDARIEEVVWRKADRSLRLMFRSVEGLPDDPGPVSGAVALVGLDGLTVDTALFRGVVPIAGIDVDTRDDGLHVRLSLSEPGADIRLHCQEVQVTLARR